MAARSAANLSDWMSEAQIEKIRADQDRTTGAKAWRDGYHTGKRDYGASITSGEAISTPNPYDGDRDD